MISVKYPPFSARGKVLESRPNLVSCAQLAPLVAPAARAGLAGWPRAKHVERPGRQSRVPVSALGWLAWSLARIRSTTWTCSGVAARAGCSAASGRPSTLGRAAPVIAATRLRRVPDFVGYGYEPGDTPRSARVTVLSTEYLENVAGVLLGVAWDRSDGGVTE